MAKNVLNGLEKANLQAIIADVKFVNETEANSYRCNNCSSIAIYHYIAKCSHVFCGKCHGQYYNKHCPVSNCRNTLIDKIYQNLEFEFGMYNLKVYCTFRGSGCENVIELSNVMVHQSTCKFSTQNLLPRLWVASPLKKLEEEVISQKNTIKDVLDTIDQFRNKNEGINDKISKKLEAKLREVKEDLAFEIHEKLVRNIDKKTKELEQSSTASILRNIETEKIKINDQIVKECDTIKHNLSKISVEQLTKEQKKLSDQIVKKFEDLQNNSLEFQKEVQIGLDNLAMKGKEELIKEQEKHFDQFETKLNDLKNNSLSFQKDLQIVSDMHYKLTNKVTEDQEKMLKEMEQLKLTNNEFGQEINSLRKQLKEQADVCRLQYQEMGADIPKCYEFSWTVTNFSKTEPHLDNALTADFISNDCKCKISTKFYLSYNSYIVRTVCAPYEIESNASECFHKTTINIFDQSNGEKLTNICRIQEPAFVESNIGNSVSITSTKITKNHIKNDSIVIKIIIEPFLGNFRYSTCSQNGTLIWKIDNYTKRKQDEIDEVTEGICSDYFLSIKEGYRMKTTFVYDVSRDGIYMQLMFVKGEFDHILKKEFRHKTTFAIIDQSDKPKKTHLIKTEENAIRYYGDLVKFTCKELENSTYLKNDCLIVKVSVEIL